MKKILLFSYNPVPTPQYTTIEGSALRFWRMALGLQEVGEYDITIAVWEKFPQEHAESNGFHITNFSSDPSQLKALCERHDAVVVSCAMGNLSKTIFDAIDDTSTRIIDAYSPMYVEFLTKSTDKEGDAEWLSVYEEYINVFNELLVRADYILIGNENQKHFYRGVLGAIGALAMHDDSRFLTLPAFVERADRAVKNARPEDEKLNVLWFGGVYPWFDINDLISAFSDADIRKNAYLTIVGGSNPFYPKENRRFNGKYIDAKERAEKLGLTADGTIVLKDWVEYADRIKVFNEADVAITMNNTYIENEYSFRLRVADLAGNGVPIITNGGDYLGESLIRRKVAFRMAGSGDAVRESLSSILKDRKAIAQARKRLQDKEVYDSLHIYAYAPLLAKAISEAKKNTATYYPNSSVDSSPVSASQVEFNIYSVDGVRTARILRVALIRIKNAIIGRMRRLG